MNLRILFPALLLSVASVQAGSFGGPAPFRNGSPLPTGTDGKYQMVASATNVTGIIGFEIADGTQTANQSNNDWVVFADGQVMRGSTAANVSDGKVAGVLDSGIGSIVTNADGTIALPVAYYIPGNSASGSFNARINLSSPTAAIEGKGSLGGIPARTDQILIISEQTTTSPLGVVTSSVEIDQVTITIPGSTLSEIRFELRGTRLSQSASPSTTSNSSTTGTATN